MELNFRKSIKIDKNTRINFSKTGGIGISTGVKGARVSVNQRGVRTTVGKGGLQYRKDYRFKNKKQSTKQNIIQKPTYNYDTSIVVDLERNRPKNPVKIIKCLGISMVLFIIGLIFPPVLLLALPNIIYSLILMATNKQFKSACMVERAIGFYKIGSYDKSKKYSEIALDLYEDNISAKKLLEEVEKINVTSTF